MVHGKALGCISINDVGDVGGDDGGGDDVDGQDNKSTGPAALERVGGRNVRRHLSRDSGWIILKGEAGI